MPKVRLDLLLVERGLAESRAKAQALVMEGQVRVDEQGHFKIRVPLKEGQNVVEVAAVLGFGSISGARKTCVRRPRELRRNFRSA